MMGVFNILSLDSPKRVTSSQHACNVSFRSPAQSVVAGNALVIRRVELWIDARVMLVLKYNLNSTVKSEKASC